MTRPALRALALAAAIVAADQATKALARANITRGDREAVFPGINLVNVRNRGVAFGLLSDGGMIVAIVTVLALVALIGFFVVGHHRPLVWLPTGLLLGGALGNLTDRLARSPGFLSGHVVDFVEIPGWPIFNVADLSICVAGGMMVVLAIRNVPLDGRRCRRY